MEQITARGCVELAQSIAEQRKLNYAAEWFRRDERGIWEMQAKDLLSQTEPKRVEHGLSYKDQAHQIALYLLRLSIEAQLPESLGRKA